MSAIRARLDRVLATRAANVAARDAIITAAETRDDQTLTADEETEFRRLVDEIRSGTEIVPDLEDQIRADDAIAAATRRIGSAVTSVRVGAEPTTYGRGSGNSYFADLARSQAPGAPPDSAAVERLARHRTEVARDLSGGFEARADMNRTDGTGGDFVPPLWLMDQYIPSARAGRVGADLCRQLPLPGGTDSINLPSVATGTAVAAQTDGATVQKTDMTTSSVTGSVKTLAGQQRFAMQLLDQSPVNFDEVVFQDLIADLYKQVDVFVLNNSASNANGILNVSSTVAVTYTDASPTVPELYPKVADGIQQIATGRFLPAQAILMHPRRWGWHLASLDSQNRPLIVPNAQGPMNAFAGFTDVRAEGSVGSLQGLPVYVDANVPINLGAGTNEDRVIIARFDDLYLYEGALRSRVLFETDADTLQVRLQVWEYLAFIGNRYPKSIGIVSGTGLVTPTF